MATLREQLLALKQKAAQTAVDAGRGTEADQQLVQGKVTSTGQLLTNTYQRQETSRQASQRVQSQVPQTPTPQVNPSGRLPIQDKLSRGEKIDLQKELRESAQLADLLGSGGIKEVQNYLDKGDTQSAENRLNIAVNGGLDGTVSGRAKVQKDKIIQGSTTNSFVDNRNGVPKTIADINDTKFKSPADDLKKGKTESWEQFQIRKLTQKTRELNDAVNTAVKARDITTLRDLLQERNEINEPFEPNVKSAKQRELDVLKKTENEYKQTYNSAVGETNAEYASAISRDFEAQKGFIRASSEESRELLEEQLKAQITRKYENERDDVLNTMKKQYDKDIVKFTEQRDAIGNPNEFTPEGAEVIDRHRRQDWINNERLRNPGRTTAYYESKYNKLNAYTDKGGTAEHLDVFRDIVQEQGTDDLGSLFATAREISGDSDKALKLIQAEYSADVAKKAQKEWLESQGFSDDEISIEDYTTTMAELYTGEESNLMALSSFVNEASKTLPDAWIGDQLEAIATSLSADPAIKSLAEDFLQESRFKSAATSDHLTQAEFIGGAGTAAQREAYKRGKAEYEALEASFKDKESEGFDFNNLDLERQEAVIRVGKLAYGTRISDGEGEKVLAIVANPENADKSVFEISASILGFKPRRNQEVAGQFLEVLSQNLGRDEGLNVYPLDSLSTLLNNDNIKGASKLVEGLISERAKKIEGQDYITESFTKRTIERVNDVEEIIANAESLNIGNIGGTIQELAGKFKGTEEVELAAALTSAVAEMRNKLLGSAVTETEERFLADMLPKLSDRPDQLQAKLERLKDQALIDFNSIRSTYALPEVNEIELTNLDERAKLYDGGRTMFSEKQLLDVGLRADQITGLEPQMQQEFGRFLNKSPEKIGALSEMGLTPEEMIEVLTPVKSDPVGAGESKTDDFLKSAEGFRTEAYLDSAGIPTIGYGFTNIDGRDVQLGDTITQEEAEAEFIKQKAAHSNYKGLITADLTPEQETALASFEYNLGANIWSSTGKDIIKAINEGDLETAADIMLAHNKAKDPKTKELVFVQGLANRRQKEVELLKRNA